MPKHVDSKITHTHTHTHTKPPPILVVILSNTPLLRVLLRMCAYHISDSSARRRVYWAGRGNDDEIWHLLYRTFLTQRGVFL